VRESPGRRAPTIRERPRPGRVSRTGNSSPGVLPCERSCIESCSANSPPPPPGFLSRCRARPWRSKPRPWRARRSSRPAKACSRLSSGWRRLNSSSRKPPAPRREPNSTR
jgi:hypothetical protein